MPHGLPVEKAPVRINDLAQRANLARVGDLDLVVRDIYLVEADFGAGEIVAEGQYDRCRTVACNE